MLSLMYSWSDSPDDVIDLLPYCSDNGIAITVQRNTIGTLSISIKYRVILALLLQQGLTLDQFLVERYARVTLYQDGDMVFGGFLSAFPAVQSSSIDADIPLVFNSWLGLTTGGYVGPVESFTDNLDAILVRKLRDNINASGSGRKPWPLSIGHCDSLARVQWDITSFKQLNDFLVERTDNSTGAGPFDINFTPDGVFEIYRNYGVNLTASMNLRFGGPQQNVTDFDFPLFDNASTDVVLSGAGNGYGGQGTAIVSRQSNPDSRKRHYWGMLIAQDSSITTRNVLDDAARKKLKYTASPIATPTISINANELGLRIREHAQHGDLWLGDVVRVTPEGIYSTYPHADSYRIDKMEITISREQVTTVKLTMVDPTGAELKDEVEND